MPRDNSRRLSILALLLITGLTIAIFALPVTASPRTQTTLPNVRLSADTVITVTVAITDGQVIVVPIDLNIVTQNLGDAANVAIIAGVEQQSGLFIGVVPAEAAAATVQLTNASGEVLTPVPSSAGDQDSDNASATVGGTHVANANSNLRAGPGTNFERIGRVPEGDTVVVVGQNDDGTWLQLEDGSWIAEFLVDPVEGANPPANNAEDDVDEDSEDEADSDEPDPDEANADEPEEAPTTLSNQAALAIYLVSIAAIGADAGDAVADVQVLMQDPQPADPQWRNDVGAQLNELSLALDQYLTLTPVPGYEDLHAEVTAVAQTCNETVNYLTSGLEDPNSINTNVATQSVQTCAAQANNLSAYLETIQ